MLTEASIRRLGGIKYLPSHEDYKAAEALFRYYDRCSYYQGDLMIATNCGQKVGSLNLSDGAVTLNAVLGSYPLFNPYGALVANPIEHFIKENGVNNENANVSDVDGDELR